MDDWADRNSAARFSVGDEVDITQYEPLKGHTGTVVHIEGNVHVRIHEPFKRLPGMSTSKAYPDPDVVVFSPMLIDPVLPPLTTIDEIDSFLNN